MKIDRNGYMYGRHWGLLFMLLMLGVLVWSGLGKQHPWLFLAAGLIAFIAGEFALKWEFKRWPKN